MLELQIGGEGAGVGIRLNIFLMCPRKYVLRILILNNYLFVHLHIYKQIQY